MSEHSESVASGPSNSLPDADGIITGTRKRKIAFALKDPNNLDYLSIPGTFYFFIYNSSSHIFLATSVDVERVFSTGRIILSHLRNRLSVQSIRALMCVGAWSKMGYVKTRDITDVTMLDDIEEGGVEEELKDGWDIINVV